MSVFKKSGPPSVTESLVLPLVVFWVCGLSYSLAQNNPLQITSAKRPSESPSHTNYNTKSLPLKIRIR